MKRALIPTAELVFAVKMTLAVHLWYTLFKKDFSVQPTFHQNTNPFALAPLNVPIWSRASIKRGKMAKK